MNRRSTSALSQSQQVRRNKPQTPNATQALTPEQLRAKQAQLNAANQAQAQNRNSQRMRAQQQRRVQANNPAYHAETQAYFEQLQATQQNGSSFFRRLLSLTLLVGLVYMGYWLHHNKMLDGVYAYFQSKDSNVNSEFASLGNENVSEADLEQIANKIIQTKAANSQLVEQYLNQWNTLSKAERRQMMDTVWYQHFAFVVESRIRDYQRRVAFGTKSVSQSELRKIQDSSLPLMKIATAVGIVKKPVEDSISTKQERFKQMMAEVEQDIREQRKSEASSSSREPVNTVASTVASNTRSFSAPKPRIEKPVSKSVSKPKQVKAPVIPIQHIVTQRDIDDVLSGYKLAYQKGDVNALLKLFQPSESLNESQRNVLLRENYETLFQLSNQRQIKLSELKWEQQGEQLFGIGRYKETFNLGGGKGSREINAKVNLELRSKPTAEGAYIANFNLFDQTITQVKPEITLSSTRKLIKVHKKPVAPTAAELQDLVARFIRVWESGNSKDLTELLSKQAKSNDKTNRAAIVGEYSQIFQTTYDREMYITNMQWETSGSFSKGRGDLEAMSFSKEDDDIKNVTGKIQIVAHREGDKVRITHLYHLTEDQ